MSTQINFHAINNLRAAERTYTERNKTYGDNYKKFGHVMQALFPNGVTINSAEQWNRFGILVQKVGKLSRYVTNPYVGHQDSVHDDICYSAMLEELDAAAAGLNTTSPVELVTSSTHAKPKAEAVATPSRQNEVGPPTSIIPSNEIAAARSAFLPLESGS